MGWLIFTAMTVSSFKSKSVGSGSVGSRMNSLLRGGCLDPSLCLVLGGAAAGRFSRMNPLLRGRVLLLPCLPVFFCLRSGRSSLP